MLVRYFDIEKNQKLVTQKKYWPILKADIEAYIKGYNVCVFSRAIRYKLYKNLHLLQVFTYYWKNLSMNIVTYLLISTNLISQIYDSILVIVEQLQKIVNYKLIQSIIDTFSLVKVIIATIM